MDLGHPLQVVTSGVDGDVLRVLAGATTDFTVSEIHGLIGEHSSAGVRKSLERLCAQGIVLRRDAGNTFLFQLNREHLGANAIVVLAHLKEQLLERLLTVLDTWKLPCAHAALFGSAARGDMKVSSDIDLFIIRRSEVGQEDPTWVTQVFELGKAVFSWTGNDVNVLEFSEEEFRQGINQDPVLAEIFREGIVLVRHPDFWNSLMKSTMANSK